MPFTPSHVLAVLPGIGPRGSRRAALLLPSALVAGSIVPDITFYVPGVSIRHSVGMHTAPGIVTTDLVAGLALVALWLLVLRAPLLELAPDAVRSRVGPSPVPPTARARLVLVVVAAVSVTLGAATHVAWDELTHSGRWAAAHVPWIAQTHGSLNGAEWLQVASSVVGLVGTAWWLEAHRRRTAPTVVRPPVLPVRRGVARALVGAVCVVAVVVVALRLGALPGIGVPAGGFALLTGAMAAVGWALVGACCAWWVWALSRRQGARVAVDELPPRAASGHTDAAPTDATAGGLP